MGEENQKTIPLDIVMQNVRVKTRRCVFSLMNEHHFPPYLMDGVICEILADIRKQEMDELSIISAESHTKEEERDG